MKTGTFFVRIWRILSILGLLFALFNSYISYPEAVAVRFDDQGIAVQYIDREIIFYIAVAIFLINNTLLSTVGKLFPRVPTDKILVPNPTLWASHRRQLNEIFANWFLALTAAINTVLALSLIVLSLLNNSSRTLQSYDYAGLLPISTAILIIVLAALPIRLFMKPDNDD
jgi:hypothetical protein